MSARAKTGTTTGAATGAKSAAKAVKAAVRLTIGGKQLAARQGETVLEVARREGIYIPALCHIAETAAELHTHFAELVPQEVDFMLSGTDLRLIRIPFQPQ